MGYRCTIHVNTALAHQVRIGRALHAGIPNSVLTDSPHTLGDTHVILGPWFALDQWRHAPNVLYIDRAYWGDPDSVSIHWLRKGEKVVGPRLKPREIPKILPYRNSEKRIYLCDYGQQPEGDYSGVRYHPADGGQGSLHDALEGYGVALGRRTTALIDAAILGLQVITNDKYSPVWPISGRKGGREQLLTRLAWHNWALTEIESGAAWEHIHAISHRHTTS
jgi:hypothetical protein